MMAAENQIVGLYADKACPEDWIVRDHEGRFWMVPPGEELLGATSAVPAHRGDQSSSRSPVSISICSANEAGRRSQT